MLPIKHKQMVIDSILNRKDGKPYNARAFYNEVREYGEIADDICGAMDGGTEEQVKLALCHYIWLNEYNIDICDYIKSVEWLDDK